MICARLLALWRSARAYDALAAKSPFSHASSSSNDDDGIVDDCDATMVSLIKEGNEPLVLHRLQHRTYTLEDLCTIEGGESVLSLACEREHLDIVTLLLDTTPFTLIPEYDTRLLSRAMRMGHSAVLELLLAKVPDIDLKVQREGAGSLLHLAAQASNTGTGSAIEWLLPRFRDVNITDDDGNTPLHIAARHNAGNLKALLKAGADIDARNKARDTPLHLAAACDKRTSVSILLRESAAMDVTNEAGKTPLDLVQSDEARTLLTKEDTYRQTCPGHRLARAGDVVGMDLWLRTIFVGDSFAQVTWRSETHASTLLATVVPTPAMNAYQLIGVADGVPVLGTWISSDFLELTLAYTTQLRRTFKGPFDLAAGIWTGVCDDAPSLHYAFPSYTCVTCANEVVLNQDAPCLTCLRLGTKEAALEYRQRVEAAAAAVTKALQVQETENENGTVVMCAAYGGHVTLLQRLLPYCTEELLHKKDKQERTALDILALRCVPCAAKAAGQNSSELVHLLNEICRISKESLPVEMLSMHISEARLRCCVTEVGDHITALAKANQWDEFKAEILRAPDTTTINREDNIIWRKACEQGRADVIALLLLQPRGHNMHDIISRGKSVLYFAAKYGHAHCVEQLLRAGVQPWELVRSKRFQVNKKLVSYPVCRRLIMAKREVKEQGFHLYFTANVPSVQAVHELQAAGRSALHAAVLYKQQDDVIFALVEKKLLNDIDLVPHLALKDTDEAFTKQAFRKAIACSPALGRLFLNDCVTLDRRDMRFSQLEHVYGVTADTSALHAILNLQSPDPALLLDAKTECLEHVVMLRILQIKWELFGQRKYFEQLLMNVLLLVTMTTSSLLVDEASVATNGIPMVVGTLTFVSAAVGYCVLQLLRPASLYRLARYCYDGQLSLDVSAPIPHLPKHKARARGLLVRAWMGLSLSIAVPVMAGLLLSGVAAAYPRCNHLVLWCTSLYFVVTELEEMVSSGIKVYWSSRVNQAQLVTNLAVLLVFVPMKVGLLPASSAVQTGVGGAITIGLWMLSLQFLEVVPAAGYLLPMMSKLLDDVRNFFIFFSVVQMGLTITFYQLFRDQDVDAFSTLGSSFVTTYFVAFGQLPLDALDAFDATDGFLSNCTLLLMMLHSAVVCILLLNVLLAMMNQTVDGGLEKAKTEALTSYAQCILRLEQSMRLDADGTQALLHLTDSKTHARVLNPIFSEVVSNLDISMRPEHEASIRHDNTRKQQCKTTLASLQATIAEHIGDATKKLRRVEHFSTDPEILRGFQPELDAIAAAEEALTSLFAKAHKHRGDDAPAKLEALKTGIRNTIRTLSATLGKVWDAETATATSTRTECLCLLGLVATTTVHKLVDDMLNKICETQNSAALKTEDQRHQTAEEKEKDASRGRIRDLRFELQARFASLETKLTEHNQALREQNEALARQLTTALEQLGRAPESPIRTQSFPVLDPRERERSSADAEHDSL
ncbi:hypothetical protein SDRG_15350 [Saprolegnia diclina VS20]|uniref:Ion transport domain-containing protein n=1 Tax=Saprolegnia diclina (strain VS20) TaxID=1156394 RepID=T0PN46_SAPDV|nr:hypothetical protein SDRG_15350 [Saprolegnia diclina VS20]EQC26839.1 hypothetical protein SDRG_15350 [Saprolegnia diclina VS20]|eukprot:XP_008619741.1 hypothetical protein SDRG_15350 [Saprolegnia diclina VS20]